MRPRVNLWKIAAQEPVMDFVGHTQKILEIAGLLQIVSYAEFVGGIDFFRFVAPAEEDDRNPFEARLLAQPGQHFEAAGARQIHIQQHVLRHGKALAVGILFSPRQVSNGFFTVASHVLHQHTLRQAATPASLDISELFAELQLASGDDPMARADGQQKLAEFERTLAGLPPKVSTTLLLHRFAGLSIEEIGRELGVSRPAAKKYLARALTVCRDALKEGDRG